MKQSTKKLTLPDWLVDRNLIAFKLSSTELKGLFTKKFTVPKDCAGLVLFRDGAVALFSEGRDVAGQFDLVLAKLGDITVRQPFNDLRSSDGFVVHATTAVTVAIQTERPDLFKDFTRSYFNFPGSYGATDLKTALLPELRRILSDFVAGAAAGDLHKRDRFRDVDAALRAGLERAFFGTGLRLLKVVEAHFAAPDYADHAAAEARRVDDHRRSEEKMGRKEQQLKRLAGILNDASVQDLFAKLPDERLKAVFYAKLMEDESGTLSPQEILAKLQETDATIPAIMYKAMEGVLSHGRQETDASDLEQQTTAGIFLALGSKVLIFDPSQPDAKPREFTFKDPLRSVRCIDSPDGPVLLVGSKRAVHAVTLADSDCVEYPLPDDRQPKGGVNAVAADDKYIWATHSEYGVARWERDKPALPAELLFGDITSRNRTTRAAQVAGDRFLFASGNSVYSVHLGNGSLKPKEHVTGVDAPVTALAATSAAVYAGTEKGTIVSWRGDDAPSILVRRKEPIVNLRLAKVCSIPHLFYSTKDLSVRARVIGQNLETSYESGGVTVGVLDAASDLIAASDAAGRRLLLWKATAPAKPAFDLDVARFSDKPILDIWMRKVRTPAN